MAAVTAVSVHFDDPWLLAGVLLGPVVLLLRLHSWRRQRRALGSFASATALRALLVDPPRYPILRALLGDVAWILTLLATAGPRWGFEEEVELARGRDVVLVLDMSQSMRATDTLPNRFEQARRAAIDLVDYLHSRPGFRLAVVAFAADAVLVCPFTEDLDYVRFRLEFLSLDDPPVEIRPRSNVRSGTSFPAALRAVLMTQDPKTRGFQDAILLSDGDDPGGLTGLIDVLAEVEQAEIPIFTIGLGDPEVETSIQVAGRDEPVRTRLNAYPLEEIARRSGGVYFPAKLSRPNLPGIFRRHIETKDRTILPGRIPPQPMSQAPWFYGAALVLLALSAFLAVRPERIKADVARIFRKPRTWASELKLQNLLRLGCWLGIALLCLTAAEPRLSQEWERTADKAMLEGRYADAEELYRRAAERTIHPARVSYKAGIASFYLGHYREAEQHFRAAAAVTSGELQTDALYNLGTTLLHRSGGSERALIEEAIRHFEAALSRTQSADRQEDLRVNLELAKLLRLRAADSNPGPTPDPDRPTSNQPGRRPHAAVEPRPGQVSEGPTGDDLQRLESSTPRGSSPSDRSDEEPMPGATRGVSLTTAEMLQPVSREEARAQVLQAMDRIVRQRRALNAPRVQEARDYPDW